MMTKNTLPVAALTVYVRMCGRNRKRIAKSLRTDEQGRVWATVQGCHRTRERLVLAIAQ